jgi:LacI family gluconate utilization system Gnt-I transcriptional repressor
VPGPARGVRAPVKITDVAAAAGVAPMTVSRVINTPDRVSAETAARVREAIERLGYVPNLIAGGLSSRRSRMVAAIVPTIAHPMFAGMVQAFTDAIRQAGYQVMLSISGYGDNDGDTALRALLGRRPDALLITGAHHSTLGRQMLVEAHIPIVEIWDTAAEPIDMLVGFDHAEVGSAVAGYFLAKGQRRFLTISADDPRALERTEGFVRAVRCAGGTVLAESVISAPSTIMAGRRALHGFLPHIGDPAALFCSSDLLAFGALTEARQHAVAVPTRLAVCGFGNFELSAATEPPFTTVHVEGAETGSLAAACLLRRLSGEPPRAQERMHVSFRIVERGST